MAKRFLLLLLTVLPAVAGAQLRINFGKDSPSRKLTVAEMAISNLYVDSVDENKLVEDAIRGMLEKLDPHSTYTTPKETASMNESIKGEFEGIGVQFNMIEDTLIVILPVMGGPSEKAGILAGDRIVTVNDTSIAGVKMDKSDIMRRLRGKKGSKVNIGVVRRGVKGILPFTIRRDKIPVNTLDAAYMIRPEIGYVRLGSFGVNSHKEVMSALDSLRRLGMKKLIFDLQDNGGGIMQAAVAIAEEFLSKGDMIVYTRGRTVPKHDYKANGSGTMQEGEVVVLINETSASASEIVAGALQDQDRALVVGRRSFGKGLVQRPIEFDDGSMIRLTIAHYYTPTGRCIQKPYKKGDLKEYEMDLENRLKHGEFTNRDSIHFADSLKFQTLRKQRTVYGGGGIMPDVFVPLDTLKYTRFHRKLAAKGLVISQALKYTDKHRKELRKKYASFQQFKAGYEVPAQLTDELTAEAAKQDIRPESEEELERTLPYLRLQVKALLARDIWGISEYFEVINEMNDIVREAVRILGD